MSSHTYTADESRVYPTLGITAERGESYELEGDPPTDGRWDGHPAPEPEKAPDAPAPAAESAPASAAPVEDN